MTVKNIRRVAVALAMLGALVVSAGYAGQAKIDVTGAWAFEVQTDAGGGSPTFTFKQEGEKLTGHYTGTFGEADVTGSVKGNQIAFTFTADFQGTPLANSYKGTVDTATSMKGTLEIAGVGSGTFTGKKK